MQRPSRAVYRMPTTVLAALIALFSLADIATPAAGQALSTRPNPPAGPVITVPVPGPSLTPADYAHFNALLARGDSLAREGKLVEAEKLYWSIVVAQRDAEEYPGEALRQLASLYFRADNLYAAANALFELADAASQFGDQLARLHALFDAALLYRDVGRADRATECVRQLRLLLKSPAIPDSVRRDIASRIIVR